MEKFTLWPDHFSITASIFVLLCFDSLSSNNKLTLILTCLLGHWGLRPCHVLSVTQVMSILNLNGRWKFSLSRKEHQCLLTRILPNRGCRRSSSRSTLVWGYLCNEILVVNRASKLPDLLAEVVQQSAFVLISFSKFLVFGSFFFSFWQI